MVVSVEHKGVVAIVRVNNPPVNALSQAVRDGLVQAVDQIATSSAKAAILWCEGRTFIAGADVREFGQPPKPPHLPDVVAAIETSPVPWIAAIHGTALGGGLEVALGCAWRIASPNAKMGLPEVNLGLIPGAGGTVRLPRLVRPMEALTMITSGKPIAAKKAREIGLIDAISDDDLMNAAMTFASSAKERPAPLIARAPIMAPDNGWKAAIESIKRKARGQNAPGMAAEAVADAIELSASDALASERDRFLKLKSDPQSAALRHIFFAERSVSKMDRLKGIEPRPTSNVGVIGGGTMGAGIAAALLLADLHVTMIERDNAALQAGIDRTTTILGQSLKRGIIDQTRHDALTARLAASTDYAALSGSDFVIEAVFEDMAVKQQVFAALDAHTPPTTVLATNTSYLDVGQIAEAVADPSRVVGLHFFSPAHIMKLAEVIHPPKVADDVLATGFALAKRLRKIAVPAGVCDGFIGNRIMSAYRSECDRMVEDGVLPWQVDGAMRGFGFPMGIFEMQDLAGLDIAWAARKRRAEAGETTGSTAPIADKLCELGRFGHKTRKGWYDYSADGKNGEPDAAVEQIIAEHVAQTRKEPRALTNEQIMDRILTRMQSEGETVLSEKVAQSADAIDVVMVNGYGFPRWRGGPMFMRNAEG